MLSARYALTAVTCPFIAAAMQLSDCNLSANCSSDGKEPNDNLELKAKQQMDRTGAGMIE